MILLGLHVLMAPCNVEILRNLITDHSKVHQLLLIGHRAITGRLHQNIRQIRYEMVFLPTSAFASCFHSAALRQTFLKLTHQQVQRFNMATPLRVGILLLEVLLYVILEDEKDQLVESIV